VKYFYFLVTLIFTCCTQVGYYEGNIPEAFLLAKTTNKNVFIVIGNNSCKKCEKYLKALNKDKQAKKALKDYYISINAKMDEKSGEGISHVMACNFFPYSCFFDPNGKLKSLRIGFEKFDFRQIEANQVNFYLYRELLNLPIEIEQYKQMVSYCLQS